ncbi:MAG: 4-hydroxythreonine-4-phosphate dehydrogenase PdxA [Bacteroidales bacterium]|nr:4-hydroxythreonine-4-phosphate dehydrogenase PdxA [Bacteroidales bacterium]
MSKPITIGITQGDTNGIGYEVIAGALSNPSITELFIPVVYGSSKFFGAARKNTEEGEQINTSIIASAQDARPRRVNIINCVDDEAPAEPGKPTKKGAEAAFKSLQAAVKDLKAGCLDAIVTAPINKQSMADIGFEFPGHTEYLSREFGATGLMFLCSEKLKVGVVTNHTPLAKVSQQLTKQLILDKLSMMNQSLVRDFAIEKPRIAVLGLNPHAGDGGALGKEEIETISPAIGEATANGILAFGPYPSDGFFATGMYANFDAVLAMYHDQGLIPFKTISFGDGVNYTAGLPIVRTSVDHGTGYDIAGQGKADCQSMRSAIYMAIDIVRNRQMHAEITANPLKIRTFESKGPDRSYLPE